MPQSEPVVPSKPTVERLFPFVLRSRILLAGRETLRHRRKRLEFVLITTDLSENSRKEILAEFRELPIVQRFTSQELESHFGVHNAKVVGFQKSGLARSIFTELQGACIQRPAPKQAAKDETSNEKRQVRRA